MGSRHENCKENSSDKRIQNVSKKCYSLPALQRENEKLKHQLNVLQAAHDEKEKLLNENLRKVELLDEKNNELKGLLAASASVNKERVEMKDASTWVKVGMKNVSTSMSVVNIAIEIQGEDEVGCKTLLFNKTVNELPYDDETGIITFEKNFEDPKFFFNMQEHFKQIGGANNSKRVNNILNAIATKNLLKTFAWDAAASNSFQNLKKTLSCIYSVVCSKDTTQQTVNNIVKNALKNARSK